MERSARLSRGEAALERLLQRIDAAVAEYSGLRRGRRPASSLDDDLDSEPLDTLWPAWWALPLSIREWLIGYVPGWWALAPGSLRRLLLTTADLSVRRGFPPRLALRRAAAQLRLPPPRPQPPAARLHARPALRRFLAAARRNRRAPGRVQPMPRRSFRAPPERPRRGVALGRRPVAPIRRTAPLRRIGRARPLLRR